MTEKSPQQPNFPAGTPPVRSRTFTPYVLIWAMLATLSLLYLGLLATQPATVAHYLGAGTKTAEAEAVATQQAVAVAVAEVQGLRETIDLFRSELIEVRAQISSQSDATRDVATRMAALEESAAPKVAAGPAAKSKKAEAAAAQKKADAAKDAPPKKAAAKKSDLETGSVAQPGAAAAITFGPPTVTPAAVEPPAAQGAEPLVGVQIATGPSVDSLRLSWTLLSQRHADSFRALEPRYTSDASGPNQSYDLILGPVGSVDEARRLCQELANKATPCTVSRFTGSAL